MLRDTSCIILVHMSSECTGKIELMENLYLHPAECDANVISIYYYSQKTCFVTKTEWGWIWFRYISLKQDFWEHLTILLELQKLVISSLPLTYLRFLVTTNFHHYSRNQSNVGLNRDHHLGYA